MEPASTTILEWTSGSWMSDSLEHACVKAKMSIIAGILLFMLWTWPCSLPKDLPGPRRFWYLPWGLNGILEVASNFETMLEYCVNANKLYGGGTWAVQMPKVGIIRGGLFFLTEPASVKHVLKDNFENYVKGEAIHDALSEFLGDGIFVADGPMWKFHRKVASHMFTARLLRESTKVTLLHATRLCDVLRAKCKEDTHDSTAQASSSDAPKGKKSCVVDMQEYFFRLTMDVFTVIAFGVDLESVPRPGAPHPFAVAFDTVQAAANRRFNNPFFKLARFLQLTREERAITQGVKVLDAFAKDVIAAKRRTLSTTSAAPPKVAADSTAEVQESRLGPDLLSRFLEDAANKEKREAEEGVAAEARTSGSDKDLRDIVLNFMIAGRDTTACALSWTLYELAKAPKECQQRLREEWMNTMGTNNDEITYEKLTSLSYAHAVTLEVLRLHPSVPRNLKVALRDDVLPDGTKIPAGCTVLWCPYAMNRDSRYWSKPQEFDPTRFLDDAKDESDSATKSGTARKVVEPSQFLYSTFNAGPRLCLGKPLALMEMKLIVGLLLRDFDFELAVPHEGGYQATIVLPMKPGLMVKLTPRASA